MTTKTRSRLSGYLFLLPYLTLFVAFMLLPLAYGLWLSFQKYEMLSRHRPQFIGVANYAEALGDRYFWKALRATCLFVVWSVPITVAAALLLALALDAVPGRRQPVASPTASTASPSASSASSGAGFTTANSASSTQFFT